MLPLHRFFFFFFNDTATTEIYTLSLHDALPISTVEPPAHPLARHEEQVLIDGDIALGRRADKPDLQRRLGRVRNVPDLESVVVPLNRVLPREREIRVGDAGELLGRRRLRDHPQIPCCLRRVHEARAQTDPGVGVGRDRRQVRAARRSARGEGAQSDGERQRPKRGSDPDGEFHRLIPFQETDYWPGLSNSSAASIFCMRAISVVWAANTSDAKRKTFSCSPAPVPNSAFTMVIAPWWCWIMNVRNSRSNSRPRARSSCASRSAVNIPGIIGAGSMPGIMGCVALGSGTSSCRSRSQRCMSAISSPWPTTIRSHRARSGGLASWLGAQPAISTACAWW